MSKNKKKWWYDKYEFDDDFYRKEKDSDYNDLDYKSSSWWVKSWKSPTKNWMDKLGTYSTSYGSSTDEKYNKVLRQLQNSVNILNKDDVVIKWSNGTNSNCVKDKIVYLSPNDVIKYGEVNDDEIDVLTGEVYLSRMIKEQTSEKDFYYGKTHNEQLLWKSLEINIAKSNFEKDWPGFIPNVLKTLDKNSCKKELVESMLQETTPSVEAVVAGVSWNLTNAHDKVEIPEMYNECLDAISDILSDENTEKNRLGACKHIINKVKKILGIEEGLSKQKMPTPMPSLFGKTISNNVDPGLGKQDSAPEENPIDGKDFKAEKSLSSSEKKVKIQLVQDFDPARYAKIVSKVGKYIQYIRNSLKFLDNTIHNHSFGHLSGDIDENNLYKLKLKDERLMSRPETISRKDIAFCFLLDESGSMAGSKVESAKEVLVSMIEGLNDKFNLSIYGHTAETSSTRGLYLREYYSKRNPFYKSIHTASGRVQNFDGMAIKIAAQKFGEDYPDSRRILFHICDGAPHTSYYMGDEAEKHVNEVSQASRKSGTEVYCIGIENAFRESLGEKMYGKGNFVILKDVHSSINILCRFIYQICNKNIATYV